MLCQAFQSVRSPRSKHRVTPTVEPLERRDLFAVSITNLGTYNGFPLSPLGINDRGQVVGNAGSPTGFLYTPGKGPVTLHTGVANVQALFVRAINNSGEIAGWYLDDNNMGHGIVWGPNGSSPVTLSGGSPSTAWDINNSGEVVGAFNSPTPELSVNVVASDWSSRTSEPEDLGAGSGSLAMAINDAGDIVGGAGTPNTGQPFISTASGLGTFLPVPVGVTGAMPTKINSSGMIVGFGDTGGGTTEAILWQIDPVSHAYTATVMGEFVPDAINDNGIVVGITGTGTGADDSAVIWTQSTGMVHLQDLVSPKLGWIFQTATAINNHNAITGRGSFHGHPVGYVIQGLHLPKLRQTPLAPDLSIQFDNAHIVPAQAPDLLLSQLFGGEQVRVPVIVQNVGLGPARGGVTITLSFHTLTPGAITWATEHETISLEAGKQKTFTFTLTVPKRLVTGGQYSVWAEISSRTIHESDAGHDTNNLAITFARFDYVGAPAHGFSTGVYFHIIRDTVQYQWVLPGVAYVEPFVATWVGDSLAPYKNAQGVPTIGVGIDLNTVSGQTKADLAAAVRAYYLANYSKTLGDDDAVIALLIKQARPLTAKRPAPQAITANDDAVLFNDDIAASAALASEEVGSPWSSLSGQEQIALVDAVYRLGYLPAAVISALNAPASPDFVWAGFALVNSLGAKPGKTATLRVEAEYQDLLAANVALL
jgi:hypothetical protein